jgi:hypothetical protein
VIKAHSFTDMAVLDGSLSTVRPSLVALACTLNAIRQEELHQFDEDVVPGGSILLSPLLIGINTHIRSSSNESTVSSFFQNVLQDSSIFCSKKDMEVVTQIQEILWQTHEVQQRVAQKERERILHSPVCVASPGVDVSPVSHIADPIL